MDNGMMRPVPGGGVKVFQMRVSDERCRWARVMGIRGRFKPLAAGGADRTKPRSVKRIRVKTSSLVEGQGSH